MADKALCTIPNCGKPRDARGLCPAHYRRWQRFGDTLPDIPVSRLTRASKRRDFLNKAIAYNGESCLIWPFKIKAGTYPLIKIDGVQRTVHSLVCEAKNGPRPFPGAEVAHSCGKSLCLAHLRWASHADNLKDRWSHGTMYMGERQWMAKLTEADVRLMRSLHASGECKRMELCKRFGVSKSVVSQVVARKAWAWVA